MVYTILRNTFLRILYFVLCILAQENGSKGYTGVTRGELMDLIMHSYNSKVRPGTNPTVVTLGVWIQHIHSVDVHRGEFKATLRILYRWEDERLSWSKVDTRERLSNILFPLRSLWQPDITIDNLISPLVSVHESATAQVTSAGLVTVLHRVIATTSCETEPESEYQECSIVFRSWMNSVDKLTLDSEFEQLTDEDYKWSKSSWAVENKTLTTSIDNSTRFVDVAQVIATFKLRNIADDALSRGDRDSVSGTSNSCKNSMSTAAAFVTGTSQNRAVVVFPILIIYLTARDAVTI